MRIFYEEWDKVLNHQPTADDLVLNEKLLLVEIHQPVADLTGLTFFQSALVIILKSYPKLRLWKQGYFIYMNAPFTIGVNTP